MIICPLEKELKWGTVHQRMTYQLKNIINLAIEDAKYNLYDIIASLTATFCGRKFSRILHF